MYLPCLGTRTKIPTSLYCNGGEMLKSSGLRKVYEGTFDWYANIPICQLLDDVGILIPINPLSDSSEGSIGTCTYPASMPTPNVYLHEYIRKQTSLTNTGFI